jgi:DNA-binding GntR family transcriptional regulator
MIHWSTPEETRESWDRRVPYHVRFRDYFASLIEAGSLLPSGKLPSERSLSDQFSINRITVRQALARMETEGLIFREERRGWFVSPQRVYYDPTANTSFTESISMQGRVAGTSILSQQQMSASKSISTLLDCAVGDPVYVINRLRSVDRRPVLVEQIHIKANRCPGLLDFPLDQSMTDLMAKEFGIIEHRTQINMRPTALPEIPAKALGVVVGTPSLYISRAILDQFNEVIELDQEFWRHDAIDIGVSAASDPQQSNPKQT